MAGVEVQLRKPSVFRGWRTTVTRADGGFVLTGMSDGQYRVSARQDGRHLVNLAEPPHRRRRADQRPGDPSAFPGQITGALRGVETAELAQVAIQATGGPDRGWAMGQVEASGRYRLEKVAAGDWAVEATLEGTGRRAEGHVRLEPGAAEANLDLEFGQGWVLSGHVLRQGEPVVGAALFLEGLDVEAGRDAGTDHAGEFRIEGLETGGVPFARVDAFLRLRRRPRRGAAPGR